MKKKGCSKSWMHFGIFLLAAGSVGPAWSDIHLAQVAPMTVPYVSEGKDANIGIRIAIDAANAKGGIAGQKIVFHAEDDEYKPEKTVALIRHLATTETLALLMHTGSPSMTRLLQEKVLESTGLPLVGVIPGVESLRNPVNPYIYHVRGGDLAQYRKLIRNALTIGLNRIAVVYGDIPSGKAGLATVESLLKEASLEPVARAQISVKDNADYSSAMTLLQDTKPNLVLLTMPGRSNADFLRAYRAHGIGATVTTLSNGNPDTLCAIATPDGARGVSIAQVFPNIQNTTIPLVREFRDGFRLYGPKDINPNVLHFEGYVTTRVLFEGIKRISGPPTREKLIKALDSMQKVNLGGFIVDFSAAKHAGSEFVDIGVISKNCSVLF